MSRYIKVIDNESKLVIRFTISKQLTKTATDILCGTMYIPPENSGEIQIELNRRSQKYPVNCIFGDYNSTTRNNDDFIMLDESQNLNEICD